MIAATDRPGFDYGAISPELANAARAAAERIRARLNESYLATGQDLIEIKKRIGHGQFGGWLKHEFGMTERTAENYMNAARFLTGKSETLSVLPPAVLYKLAAPSAPAAVVAEVVESADAGTIMPVQFIREKLATAVKAERQAAAEAAKSLEQRKREKVNAARRRANDDRSQLKWQQEDAERNRKIDEQAGKIADWLIEKLGDDSTKHLLGLVYKTGWHHVERALKARGVEFRYWEIESCSFDDLRQVAP